jgi:hypothetical protein
MSPALLQRHAKQGALALVVYLMRLTLKYFVFSAFMVSNVLRSVLYLLPAGAKWRIRNIYRGKVDLRR